MSDKLEPKQQSEPAASTSKPTPAPKAAEPTRASQLAMGQHRKKDD